MSEKVKVGVMRFGALGDVALALPFLRALTIKPLVITASAGRELLSDEFSDFVVLESKSIMAQARVLLELRRRRLDVLIDLQSNDRSRVMSRMAGAGKIFERDFPPRALPAAAAWQKILAASGLLGPLDLTFTPKPRNYIALNAGSSPQWLSKRLPDRKWREISALLRERFNLPFVLTGSPEEREYVEHLAGHIEGPAENRAGQTSLKELKRLLAGAFLTVSTDSAAMHISAAMKTPTIGIFGATDWTRSAPFGPWTRVVYDRVHYPDGVPPAQNIQTAGPYYDHVDITVALQGLSGFCGGSDRIPGQP